MAEHGKRIELREILIGGMRFLLLSIGLLVIQHLIAPTAPVESVKDSAYSLLQLRLASTTDPSKDIQVVDIDGFPKTPRADLRPDQYPTSRTELLALLNRIADNGAAAIGVDIDFSPEDDGNYVLPDDPEFFDHVQELCRAKSVAIFLGVWRQSAGGPENWLGSAKFADRSAGLPVPNENTRRMPLYVQTDLSKTPLRTISASLAGVHSFEDEIPPNWSIDMLESRFSRDPAPGLRAQEIAVDYSQIENFVRNKISWQEVIRSKDLKRFHGKIVLIGDGAAKGAETGPDMFPIPGREKMFGGVFLHASAAYSALKAPLYEFREGADVKLDLMVGAVLLIAISGIKFRLRNDSLYHPKSARYTMILYGACAALLLVFGVWFVNVTRTMWDDFPIFIAALFIHHVSETFIEHRLETRHPEIESSEVRSPEPASSTLAAPDDSPPESAPLPDLEERDRDSGRSD